MAPKSPRPRPVTRPASGSTRPTPRPQPTPAKRPAPAPRLPEADRPRTPSGSGTVFRDAITGGGSPAVKPYVGPYRDGVPERTGLDTTRIPYLTAYGEAGRALGGAPGPSGGFPLDPWPGGGGGGGGGRGGGGGGGVDPKTAQAYKDLYTQMSTTNDQQMWDTYEGLMRKAYDPARINATYDEAGRGVKTAAKAGLDRLAPIFQQLSDRGRTARTAVSDAYGQGDARLKALQGEYVGASNQAVGGMNNMLAGFDAGSIAPTGTQNLQNLFAASRVANEGYRSAADVGLADRDALYGGLNADVQSGITRDQVGLESRIAQQRMAAGSQNDLALQQVLAQTGISRVQSEQQRKRDELEMRARLAEMGITV